MSFRSHLGWGLVLSSCLTIGCSGSGSDSQRIRVEGSDTMINLAVSWSEAYRDKKPDVSIEVSGNGSGIGIKTLAEGDADLANSSREMEPEEMELTETNTGKAPVKHIVGYFGIWPMACVEHDRQGS